MYHFTIEELVKTSQRIIVTISTESNLKDIRINRRTYEYYLDANFLLHCIDNKADTYNKAVLDAYYISGNFEQDLYKYITLYHKDEVAQDGYRSQMVA